MSISIGEIIGEGNFRTTYAVKDKDLCLKKHKKYVTKIIYGLKIDFRSNFFIFLKFGVSDLNVMEYKAIKKMPAELTPYIPSDIEFIKGEGLVMGRAKDVDGTYSEMMANFGPIHNKAFWEHIERMIKIFEDNNIYPSDILYKGNNLIVKKVSDEEWIPIIIDFKRMNMGYDLFSRFEFGSKKTFYRRLKRFKEAFKPKL
ncbi:hypothetical protein GTQ40_06000 [Flavobacteriaceae bacterium R38]|nr:hypothetical protein [Flavobacteriaceae bacterium R38]